MARTKQTARKSTGGAAPRKLLASLFGPSYHSLKYPLLPATTSQSPVPVAAVNFSTAAPSEAQNKVLSTPDLLIIILSQLPHSSLLKAKLVNKTWASLFDHVEIQAALFLVPRPKGSAMYTERYSDLVMDRWVEFWSVGGVFEEEEEEEDDSDADSDGEDSKEIEIDGNLPDEEGSSKDTMKPNPIKLRTDTDRLGRTTIELRLTHSLVPSPSSTSPHSWQWRQILFSQPPIQNLELVQQISRREGFTLEFRTTIHRPNGLTMGFLYDAVRYWHEVEQSSVQLLWGSESSRGERSMSRKVGDLVNRWVRYPNRDGKGEGSVTREGEEEGGGEKDCVTIRGHTSVGCGQYGGLTYANWGPTREGQTRRVWRRYIKSGDEHVGFEMGEPREVRYI